MDAPTITVTRGLPGSGKSTWAQGEGGVLISRDDVRHELYGVRRGPRHRTAESDAMESHVSDEVRLRVIAAVSRGLSVIVDSMNADPAFVEAWRGLAESLSCNFRVRTFRVPVETLLERNAARDDSTRVYEDEIRALAAAHPELV